LLNEFTTYYNTRRAHMVREHLPPVRAKPDEVIPIDRAQVVVRSYVVGLVKSSSDEQRDPNCPRWVTPNHSLNRAAAENLIPHESACGEQTMADGLRSRKPNPIK
jgi:hypothetical protein